ncbi:hypothetical protein VNI00_002470 [Paramarasmius palmivorus]|uniref:N-acetyltransferase domain-containing protein n=1 Tax=Paramarasmius palmivorus TaxID=297713 RepID=A0AAW0DZ88_9AGAR
MFTTERLTLRAFQESDMEHMFKLWNTEAVQRTISVDYHVPRAPKYKETFERMANEAGFFVIIETKDTKQFAGFASLDLQHRKHRDSQYAIALLPEFWGKGYATEATRFIVNHAFVSMGLHRVTLGVLGGNDAAANVYKKIGFVEEGRSRKAFWLDGKWVDDVHMSILDEEWAALTASTSS